MFYWNEALRAYLWKRKWIYIIEPVLPKMISKSSLIKYLTYVLSFPSTGSRYYGQDKKGKASCYALRQQAKRLSEALLGVKSLILF